MSFKKNLSDSIRGHYPMTKLERGCILFELPITYVLANCTDDKIFKHVAMYNIAVGYSPITMAFMCTGRVQH